MMTGKQILWALAGASVVSLAAAPAPASAQGQNQTYVDVQGGLGYSSNPNLRVDGVGSGFARVSAYGFHGWGDERSNSNVSAYVENTSYFRRLGNQQVFSLNAANATSVNEKVRVFGSLAFSGDFGAQLSSRFFGPPADAIQVDPLIPPTSVIVVTPDLLALTQRQYRVGGTVGASYVLSPRDSLTGTIGASRVWFKGGAAGNGDLLDQNLYDASMTWRRQFTERVSAGIRLIAGRADYTLGRTILTYGPQVTADLQLSESTQLGGAVGFVRTERDFGPVGADRNSTDLALDASLCRTLEYERFCGRVGRRTQSVAIGAAPTSTSLTADYSRRLSARDQIQAGVAFVTTGDLREIGLGRQNFYSLSGSFDRRISPRLSAGVSLAARKFTISGPDPKADLGGSLFIRNRFGSIR
jgi:hypothetical protein